VKRILVSLVVVASFGIWGAAAASASPVHSSPAARTVQPGGRILRARSAPGSQLPTISLNWSGYAAIAQRKFTYVHASFVQPKISCPGKANQWTSNWAGLDGFTNATVEQDGTFGFCAGTRHTTPVYVAWYEMYPAGSVNVFAVHPGDRISATVRYTRGKFVLTIADLTLGKSVTHVASCSTCQRASAEWIVERPALCSNKACTKAFLTELADFHQSQMRGQAQVAGQSVKGIGSFVNYPIYMVNPLKSGGFISLDTVGAVAKSAFTATWDRAGTIYPITL
jgi:Peptidase A4 family